MEYEAVFFDFDNTLYPYDPCNEAGKRAARETARELGYELDREEFETLYQDGRRETKRELGGRAASHERYLYFKHGIRRHTGRHGSADAFELGRAYWDGYVEEMELFDGVEETLRTLREAGVDAVVTTNLTTHVQLRKLRELGLDPLVDVVVTSEETGREKPSAIMFTVPLARLDYRPSEALMVGDDIEADVVGANAVGMDTVLFNADPERELTGSERPDRRIEEFADLTELVL